MRKIIVVAYQLHYSKGSEYSVAWNYINHMNQNNLITVLYGTSGDFHQIGETSDMESYCKNHQVKNVTIIPVRPSFKSKNYNYSLIGQYFFYREYRCWHNDVNKYISQLIKKEKYDLIHFLGPIGYREPGYLYFYPLPYIWGPIGGFGGANPKLLSATCSFSAGIGMLMKRLANTIHTHLSIRTRKALKKSDVVICATTEYKGTVEKLIGKNHHSIILYRTENCIFRLNNLNERKFNDKVHIAFVGRIDENKGLIFILKALRKLGCNKKLVLDVVGDDRMNGKMETWAKKNGINSMIQWHGIQPRDKVFNILNNAQLLLILSLNEANTTVIWEAMAMGTPVLTLDHKGMHDIVTDKSGYKIKVHSCSQIVNDIAKTLQEILDNPKSLRQKANEVLKEREKHTWDKRIQFFENVYDLAENQFKIRCTNENPINQ